MKVAELVIVHGNNYGTLAAQMAIGFTSVEAAKAEFDRITDLLGRREKRSNDLDKMVTIDGAISHFSCPLEQISSVSMLDYAVANDEEAGVKDAFPNIFKR